MKLYLLLPAIIFVCSCSSYLNVYEMPKNNNVGNGDSIKGIPFRLLEPSIVHVYKYDEEKDSYVEVHSQQANLPNQNKLYAINFTSQYFSDANFVLNVTEDNTISSAQLNSDYKADEVLSQLASTTSAVANSIAQIEAERIRAEETKETKEQRNLEAAQLALIDVKKAEESLKKAKPEEISIKEAELKLAKIKANHAFRNAGLPAPFPGIFP